MKTPKDGRAAVVGAIVKDLRKVGNRVILELGRTDGTNNVTAVFYVAFALPDCCGVTCNVGGAQEFVTSPEVRVIAEYTKTTVECVAEEVKL